MGHQTGPRPGDDVLGAARPAASIVVPAHDEQAVIGRLLDSLAEGLDGARLDVVVACNGCTDRTADIARDRGARVVEVAEPSKIAALDAGDAAAVGFPRFYVDADVVLAGRAVLDVASALAEPGALAGAPPIRVDSDGRSWAVRGFYAVWDALPYFEDAPIGSGVYAVPEAGRARFDHFPDVIADDLFAPNLFRRSERRVPDTDPFVMERVAGGLGPRRHHPHRRRRSRRVRAVSIARNLPARRPPSDAGGSAWSSCRTTPANGWAGAWGRSATPARTTTSR